MNEITLNAADRPRMRYDYIVQGTGEFPYDMLRYDRAFPYSEFDAGGMTHAASRLDASAPRRVDLSSYSRPTQGRWRSFGWEIIEEQ